jgi:hypothetical protein
MRGLPTAPISNISASATDAGGCPARGALLGDVVEHVVAVAREGDDREPEPD